MRQVDAKGRFLSFFNPPTSHQEILKQMLSDTAIAHASVMIKTSIIREAGGYDPKFPHVEDTELWSRLIFKTQFANLPEALYERRLHQNSIMNKHSTFQEERSREIRERLLSSLIGRKLLNKDDLAEIRLMKNTAENSPIKKFLFKLKNILPSHLRHRLRVSPFGKFLNWLIK